jgi:hypothetical protein
MANPVGFGPLLEKTEAQYEQDVARIAFLGELELSDTAARQITDFVRDVWARAAGPQLEEWVRRYPLVFARWLVGLAGEVYVQGALWPHVAAQLQRDDATRVGQLLGPLFLDVIRRFRLRVFPGLRYVASILGHSMVPESNLDELLCIIDGARRTLPGTVSPAGLWEALRQHPMRSTLPKPLQRFFDTDPDVGAAYVDRLRQFIIDNGSVEVPTAVHRAWHLVQTRPSRQPPVKAKPAEGPVIRTDGINAPLVVDVPLAAVPRVRWRVRWNDTVLNLAELAERVSANEVVPIPVPCRACQVLDGDEVVARAEAWGEGVWVFDAQGRVWARPYLAAGLYTLILPSTWRLDGVHVQYRDKPWLGKWGAWMLVEVECLAGRVLRVVDAASGVRLQAGVVEPLRRHPFVPLYKTAVGQPLVVEYFGQIAPIAPVPLDMAVTPASGGPATHLRQALSGNGPYRLALERPLDKPGSYAVTVRHLFGEDTFQVEVLPEHEVTVSRDLEWPRPSGFHRSGTVFLTVPTGVTVRAGSGAGSAGRYRHRVQRETYELTTTLVAGPDAFSVSVPVRSAWWEWASERAGRTENNGPLHTTWTGLKDGAWRLRLWTTGDIQVTLRLTDSRHLLREWKVPPGTNPFELRSEQWTDNIDGAAGDEFHLLAVSSRGTIEGAFLLAWIQRPVFQDVAVDADVGLVRWHGPDPGPCIVTVGPVRADGPTNTVQPQLVEGAWTLSVPLLRSLIPPIQVTLDSRRHGARDTGFRIPPLPAVRRAAAHPTRVTQLEQLAEALDTVQQRRLQVAVRFELHRWAHGRGHVPPTDPDRSRWVAAYLALPPTTRRTAYRQVVAPSVPRDIPAWLDAVLQQPPDLIEVAWIRLGVPQWPLGALGTKAAQPVLARWDDVARASPLLAWLVLTGTEYGAADPSWRAADQLAALFGRTTEGHPVALDLLAALDRNEPADRERVLSLLRSACEAPVWGPDLPLVSAPAFCPTDPVVARPTAAWLEEKFRALSSAQGWLPNTERLWADYGDSVRALMRVTCLQRARAYGLWQGTAAEDERLYVAASECVDVAPDAYRQALLRADLCVALEHRMHLSQEV